MKEDRCIVCGEKKKGLPIKEDRVISAIRWIKRNITRNEKGYHLVVCKECYPKYDKIRKAYEKRRMLYIGLGAVFAVLIIAISSDRIIALLYGIAVLVFLYLLSLISYVPTLDISNTEQK